MACFSFCPSDWWGWMRFRGGLHRICLCLAEMKEPVLEESASFRRCSVLGRGGLAGHCLSICVFRHPRFLWDLLDVYSKKKAVCMNSRIWSWICCFQETSTSFRTNEKTEGPAVQTVISLGWHFPDIAGSIFFFIIFMLTVEGRKLSKILDPK